MGKLPFAEKKEDFTTIINDHHDFDYLISKPKCVFHTDSTLAIELPYFIIFVLYGKKF